MIKKAIRFLAFFIGYNSIKDGYPAGLGGLAPYSHNSYTSDLIFIDGRAGPSCIFHAIKKVRSGGYLLLDNSEREEYQPDLALLSSYKRTDFFGLGPCNKYFWRTSIWRIT